MHCILIVDCNSPKRIIPKNHKHKTRTVTTGIRHGQQTFRHRMIMSLRLCTGTIMFVCAETIMCWDISVQEQKSFFKKNSLIFFKNFCALYVSGPCAPIRFSRTK